MSRGGTRAALIAILTLAASLRMVGLTAGLRHTPHWDERVFVEHAARMASHLDFDHQFYEYPGLFFYLLAPVLALGRALHPPLGLKAYLLARGWVAAFGVLSVGLVYRLGARLVDRSMALLAAALLAVSPVEVWTAHEVRPDVVLESFALAALLCLMRPLERWRDAVRAAIALGSAMAVKFSGALLIPSFVIGLMRSRPRTPVRIVALLCIAVATTLLFTPAAALHPRLFLGGVRTQMSFFYEPRSWTPQFGAIARYYIDVFMKSLGPIASLMALVGAVDAARRERAWLPLLVFPALTLVVFSTADARFDRFMVPVLGVLALLAARGFSLIRYTGWTWVLAALAIALPLRVSIDFLREIVPPSTWDHALDWMNANAAPGTRVLTGEPDLGLDRTRFEVVPRAGASELDRELARNVDYVVTAPGDPVLTRALTLLQVFEPLSARNGRSIAIYRHGSDGHPDLEVSLAQARLTASENAGAMDAVRDGHDDTSWTSDGPQHPGMWLEVALPERVRLARVDLRLGTRPQRYGRDIQLWVRLGPTPWQRVRVVPGRPAVEEQRGDASQVLVIEPVSVDAVRIVQMGSSERRWAVAELELIARPDGAERQP